MRRAGLSGNFSVGNQNSESRLTGCRYNVAHVGVLLLHHSTCFYFSRQAWTLSVSSWCPTYNHWQWQAVQNFSSAFNKLLRVRMRLTWSRYSVAQVGVLLTTPPHTSGGSWESTWTPLPHYQKPWVSLIAVKINQFEACMQYVRFKLCLIWVVRWGAGDGPKVTVDRSALGRLKHMGHHMLANYISGTQTLLCWTNSLKLHQVVLCLVG